MTIHLTLLPEFGWSINGQHVYGPGSVFQGKIKDYIIQCFFLFINSF